MLFILSLYLRFVLKIVELSYFYQLNMHDHILYRVYDPFFRNMIATVLYHLMT